MSEYTPGPWKVLNNTRGYPYQIYAPNSSGGPGGIKSITRGAAITLPSSDEGKANARLIAAAPQMLEALKLAREYVAATEGTLLSKPNIVTPDLEKIDAAIKAAEGTDT